MNRAIKKILNSELSAADKLNSVLVLVIDEMHPTFKSVSDEIHITVTENYMKASRVFKNLVSEQKFNLTWETVNGENGSTTKILSSEVVV